MMEYDRGDYFESNDYFSGIFRSRLGLIQLIFSDFKPVLEISTGPGNFWVSMIRPLDGEIATCY